MGTQTPSTSTAGGGNGKADFRAPEPPPEANLSPRERKVWDYICQVLSEEGLPVRIGGIAITIICKTFIQYVQAEKELQNYIASNKGSILQRSQKSDYSQPHPLYYAARDIKLELLKWLPEACLSLPSAVMAKTKKADGDGQDDLFEDLLAHAKRERSGEKRPAAHESTSPA